jgi:glycosyltransferase involved in cell wall biosynthesis
MKILIIAYNDLKRAGVQSVIMEIVRNIGGSCKFDIVLFSSKKSYYDEEFLSYGGKIFRLPHYEGNNTLRKRLDIYLRGRRLYSEIHGIIEKNGPYDAIHCHNEFESGLCLKAAKFFGIPLRISHTHVIHDGARLLRRIYNNYRRYQILKYSTDKIGCSMEACKSLYGEKENYIVINNPYDEKRFSVARFEHNVIHRLTLLQIGSYSYNKNQLFSLNVMKFVLRKEKDAILHFIGFDSDISQQLLEDEIKDNNLLGKIFFHKCDADAPLLLSQSTGFLFPSVSEGFGLVLVEAQAMGVKCFASDTVPRTTNLGGVQYIPLYWGAKKWADIIVKEYEKNQGRHENYNCSAFATGTVMRQYKNLYREK